MRFLDEAGRNNIDDWFVEPGLELRRLPWLATHFYHCVVCLQCSARRISAILAFGFGTEEKAPTGMYLLHVFFNALPRSRLVGMMYYALPKVLGRSR